MKFSSCSPVTNSEAGMKALPEQHCSRRKDILRLSISCLLISQKGRYLKKTCEGDSVIFNHPTSDISPLPIHHHQTNRSLGQQWIAVMELQEEKSKSEGAFRDISNLGINEANKPTQILCSCRKC